MDIETLHEKMKNDPQHIKHLVDSICKTNSSDQLTDILSNLSEDEYHEDVCKAIIDTNKYFYDDIPQHKITEDLCRYILINTDISYYALPIEYHTPEHRRLAVKHGQSFSLLQIQEYNEAFILEVIPLRDDPLRLLEEPSKRFVTDTVIQRCIDAMYVKKEFRSLFSCFEKIPQSMQTDDLIKKAIDIAPRNFLDVSKERITDEMIDLFLDNQDLVIVNNLHALRLMKEPEHFKRDLVIASKVLDHLGSLQFDASRKSDICDSLAEDLYAPILNALLVADSVAIDDAVEIKEVLESLERLKVDQHALMFKLTVDSARDRLSSLCVRQEPEKKTKHGRDIDGMSL